MNIVYTSNVCPSCIQLYDSMRRNGTIRYVAVRNIDVNPSWRQELMNTGSRSVPTGLIGGRLLIGALPIQNALNQMYGA